MLPMACPAPQSESPAEEKVAKTAEFLRKTTLCIYFSRGWCKSGSGCTFAHGERDLAARPDFSFTQMCKTYLSTGACPVGSDCKFAHRIVGLRSRCGPPTVESPSVAENVDVKASQFVADFKGAKTASPPPPLPWPPTLHQPQRARRPTRRGGRKLKGGVALDETSTPSGRGEAVLLIEHEAGEAPSGRSGVSPRPASLAAGLGLEAAGAKLLHAETKLIEHEAGEAPSGHGGVPLRLASLTAGLGLEAAGAKLLHMETKLSNLTVGLGLEAAGASIRDVEAKRLEYSHLPFFIL